MKVVRAVEELRTTLAAARQRGDRVGLVPTMGALHDGHRALLRAARAGSDVVVMSLFVNPAQFDDPGDLERYPRDEASDLAIADAEGADLVFGPSATALYPPGFDTWVDPGAIGEMLEGAARPGHFRGVATICAKLFSIVQPARAWFGQKDAQQVAVVRQVVRDLDLPVEIVAVPTVRAVDGLALSSRNARLSPGQRAAGLALPRALEVGLHAQRAGGDPVSAARTALESAADVSIDYVDLADFDGPTLVAAVRVGDIRLIDNVRLTES